MKNPFQIILAAALLSGGITLHAAPSAEEILKEHVKAIGGEAAFKKMKSREMIATFDIPSQGLSADMKITTKAPNKMRTELDIPGMGKIVEGFDGTVAWSQNPFTGLLEKEGDQLKQAKEQADFYRDVEIAKRYEKWTVKGKEKVGGKDAYVLVGSSADGSTETMFIDADSYLLLKVTAQAETPAGKMDASTILSDYKTVDGLKLPFNINIESAAGSMTMKIKEIKNNVEVPDSLFSKPTN